MELAHEGTRRQGRRREENAEGGETEATLAVSDVRRRLKTHTQCRLSFVNYLKTGGASA